MAHFIALPLAVNNFCVRHGYGISGQKSYELFPRRYDDVFQATAARIDAPARLLQTEGVNFVVMIVPYEMQISQEAAEVYQRWGIQWEGDEFLDRGPQRQLMRHLKLAKVIDLYYAFIDQDDPARARSKYKVGECFVYNEGDKLDWCHPNRKGHRLMAESITRQDLLATTSSP